MKPDVIAFPRWIKATLVIALLALLASGIWFYRIQEQTVRHKVEEDLSAIARLKADQITAWRKNQLGDAAALQESVFFLQSVVRFLVDPSDDHAGDLRTHFRILAKQHDYADILLVDPDARVLLSLSDNIPLHSGYTSALSAALREHTPMFIDLHTEMQDPTPHISVVTPLVAGAEHAQRPLCAVILVSHASQFLYPLIQSWPTPSKTAETLLVRRDGNDVLFLNELRSQRETALKLRIPLTRTDVPAVMAVLGREGLVEGKDYRGVDVVSVILPIPDSPWFMVAKVDAAEVFADWRFQSVLILALFLGLTSIIMVAGLVLWQREKKSHYRAQYFSEAALRTNLERHSTTLKSIGDAVIATDALGVVELLNPVAEALTGWTDAEARGKPLEAVFCIVNEETGEKVDDPVAKVLREGTVVGLANHTLLIARDGVRRPIADSGAPILGEKNEITGVVLVFRDQTEERWAGRMAQARLALIEYAAAHTLEELMTRALDEINELVDSPIGFYHFVEADQKTISLQQWSTRTLTQFCRAEGKGVHYPIEKAGVWADCARQKRPIIHNNYASLKHKQGMPEGHAEVIRELVVPVMRNDEVVAILGIGNKPVDYTEKDVAVLSYLSDVTWEIVARKRTEDAWQNSEKRYRRLFESAKDGILILDADTGKVVDVNPFLSQLLGYSHETFLGNHLWEIGMFKNIAESKDAFNSLKDKEYIRYDNLPLETADGRIVEVEFVSNVYLVDHAKVIQCNIRDISKRKQAEKALIDSERKWRNILVDTPQIGISLDPQARIVFANAHFLKLTGWTEQEILGRDWFGMFIPETVRDEVRQIFLNVMRNKDTLGFMSFENDILTRTGDVRSIAWSNVLTKDAQGAVLDVTCLGVDLTERKRAEEELRQSEANYRLLVENQTDMVVKVDTEGRFLFVSPSYCRIFGKTEEELLWQTFMPLVHEEDREPTAKAMEALFRPPHTAYIEQRALTKDGWAWIEWADTAVLDSRGKVIEIIGVGRDITKLKRAEAQRRQLSDIIEKSLNEIFVFDSQTLKFRDVNQGALKNLQYTLEEIKEMTPLDLKPELTEATFRAMVEPLLAGAQESLTFETSHLRADGSLYPVEVHLQLMDADGDRVFLAVIFDITERKRAEENREKLQAQLLQAQKMESVGRLAGGVAHDYNNMLSVILGYTELALDKVAPSEPLHADLKEIFIAAKRSTEITRQLLAFARKQTIAPKVLDLNEKVDSLLKMLRRLIGEDIDMAWLPESPLWHIKIDPSQIEQVLANLCINARDAIAGVGKVTIETHMAAFDEGYCADHSGFVPGEFVLLAVSDDGCGMGRETLDSIFEPFFTTKNVNEGTGLGLATVYGIVKQNNGFINVYSEPGKGTTFRIYLPRHVGDTGKVREEIIMEIPLGHGEMVLLVEDESAIMKMGQMMLERLGYQVLAAGTPGDAVHLAGEHMGEIHLLITDVVMPEMNGRDLADQLHNHYPDIKTLFMSGYTANVIAHRGVLDEGVNFIQKPFSMKDLGVKVRAILDQE